MPQTPRVCGFVFPWNCTSGFGASVSVFRPGAEAKRVRTRWDINVNHVQRRFSSILFSMSPAVPKTVKTLPLVCHIKVLPAWVLEGFRDVSHRSRIDTYNSAISLVPVSRQCERILKDGEVEMTNQALHPARKLVWGKYRSE